MPARKTTAEKEAVGTFKRNPSRRPVAEPVTGKPVGDPPEHLTDEQAAVWREIVGICAIGAMQSSDRISLEMLVVQVAKFRKDPEGFGGRSLQTFLALLARFGMTPVDRARVIVASGPEKPTDPAAEFFH